MNYKTVRRVLLVSLNCHTTSFIAFIGNGPIICATWTVHQINISAAPLLYLCRYAASDILQYSGRCLGLNCGMPSDMAAKMWLGKRIMYRQGEGTTSRLLYGFILFNLSNAIIDWWLLLPVWRLHTDLVSKCSQTTKGWIKRGSFCVTFGNESGCHLMMGVQHLVNHSILFVGFPGLV